MTTNVPTPTPTPEQLPDVELVDAAAQPQPFDDDPRVKAFDEWAATQPVLKDLVADPNTQQVLRRVFLCGAVTQESLDAAALDVLAQQRDFLDQVCARSSDLSTSLWRRGFEDGCPRELIWDSKSGGIGVEGEEAHRQPAALELHLYEVVVHERLCWVVADSEPIAAALALQTVEAAATRLRDDDNALRMLAPLGDSPYAGKTLIDAAAEQKATGRPGYIGSRTW